MADTRWVNSGDSHVIEPLREWVEELPERLHTVLPHVVVHDDHEDVILDGQTFRRRRPSAPRIEFAEKSQGPPSAGDVTKRLTDMDAEGVWGEVVFPTVGMWSSSYRTLDDHRTIVQFGNDWLKRELLDRSPRFVPAAQMPMLSVDDAIAELQRCAGLGFHCVHLATTPAVGVPDYNDEVWEPFWANAEEASVVVSFHVGTDPVDFETGRVRGPVHSGPGDAVLNYTETSFTGQRVAMKLVASGALDRHPDLRILIAEAGAAWVPALGDRMNEAYAHHSPIVLHPLERSPKEILFAQIYATFQHGESAPLVAAELGYRNVMWGRDYPHLEGTWGHTQQVIDGVYASCDARVADRITRGAFAELFPHVGEPPANDWPAGADGADAAEAPTA